MVTIFIIGGILTIFTLYITLIMCKNKAGYIECIKDSFKDTPFLTIMLFILQIAGVLMLYFGFVTPSYEISDIIDNKDGTITCIEYSLSGDCKVKDNVKAPVESYGVITNIGHKNKWSGKIVLGYIEVTYKLNDGRIITKEYTGEEFKKKIKIGNSVKAIETFYPSYNIKFLH